MAIESWLMDMDGVLVHEANALPGADRFLETKRPDGTAFVVGESGISTQLYQAGYTLTDNDPDYVILGETRTYSFERITRAIRLIANGARFIATNPDATGPSREGQSGSAIGEPASSARSAGWRMAMRRHTGQVVPGTGGRN